MSVSAVMPSASSNLTIAADPFGWGSATVNGGVYTMVASDCANSTIFAGKVSGGGVQIDHSTAMGNAAATFPLSAIYGLDAIVMPVGGTSSTWPRGLVRIHPAFTRFHLTEMTARMPPRLSPMWRV